MQQAVPLVAGRYSALRFHPNNDTPTLHHKYPFDHVEVYLQNAPFAEDGRSVPMSPWMVLKITD